MEPAGPAFESKLVPPATKGHISVARLARHWYSDAIRRFGGEQFMSTELDLLGPQIWRMMKEAESGLAPADVGEPGERRVRFYA